MTARGWRRTGAVLAAGVLALLPAVPAAAVSGHITQIDEIAGTLRIVFSADSLPAGVSIDPKSVTLTLDGKKITSNASLVSGSAVLRSTELVIDTSGSMKGEGIAGAKAAALSFVDAVPKDVRVGVVAFADKAGVRVKPTLDRDALHAAINALQPAGETALYDGVLLGLRELGATGSRTMLVLSDGADTVSKAKLPAVLSAASAAKGVTIDTVAFKTPEGTGAVLRQVATAGHGAAIAAGSAASIGAAFKEAARAISNQIVITADVPEGLTGRVNVAVTAKAARRP